MGIITKPVVMRLIAAFLMIAPFVIIGAGDMSSFVIKVIMGLLLVVVWLIGLLLLLEANVQEKKMAENAKPAGIEPDQPWPRK